MSKTTGETGAATARKPKRKRRHSNCEEQRPSRKRVQLEGGQNEPRGLPEWVEGLRRLTPEERKRYRAEHRCFACRKAGHRSDDSVCELHRFRSTSQKKDASPASVIPDDSDSQTSDSPLMQPQLEKAQVNQGSEQRRPPYLFDPQSRPWIGGPPTESVTRSPNDRQPPATSRPSFGTRPPSDELFTVDTAGYSTIPSTPDRISTRYDRRSDLAILGDDGSSCSSPDVLLSATLVDHNARESTPELSTFLNTRPSIVVDRSRIPRGTKKFYGVRHGRTPGVYFAWQGVGQTEEQVKGFKDARHRGFTTIDDALAYVNHNTIECDGHCCQPERERAEGLLREIRLSRPQKAPPTSGVRSGAAVSPVARNAICDCGRTDLKNASIAVCANSLCAVTQYHGACVGLSNRKTPPGWRCRSCRTAPPVVAPCTSSEVSEESANAPGPPLSAEQADVVKRILEGENVCYLGSAGTGKSTVLKAATKALKARGKWVDIIATSGIAALNVGGQTIYTYAGWYPESFKAGLPKLKSNARWGKKVRNRLGKTDVLVIEEVSMLEADMFEALDQICREARDGYRPAVDVESVHDADLPFGGMQVIVTGDFCQLPPVAPFRFCLVCGGDELKTWADADSDTDDRPLTCSKCNCTYKNEDKWAFRADAWAGCKFAYIELKQIHRQSDAAFIELLQCRRHGIPFTTAERKLLTAPRKAEPGYVIELCPTKSQVKTINDQRFGALPGAPIGFECCDYKDWREEEHPELENRFWTKYSDRKDGPLKSLKDHRLEERVEYKVGTIVLLLVNLSIEQGLVNGTQGKIIGFRKFDEMTQPLPEQYGGYADIKREQIRVFMDKVKSKCWPVVEFNNGAVRTISASCQLTELGPRKPYSLIGRTQIPLLPAWAITVHKSQGMTLSRVVVNLARCFEQEMVYVALSRARGLDGQESSGRFRRRYECAGETFL